MSTTTMPTTSHQMLHSGSRGNCESWAHPGGAEPTAAWWVVVELAATVRVVVDVCDSCARALVEAGNAYVGADGGPAG